MKRIPRSCVETPFSGSNTFSPPPSQLVAQGLAEFFGFNDSKFQWAIVEKEYQDRQAAERAKREQELQEAEEAARLTRLEEQQPPSSPGTSG
jgi:hypothetical protein